MSVLRSGCLGLLASVACAPGAPTDTSGPIHLVVAASAYAPGDTADVRLANSSTTDVGYNLCSAQLERRAGSGWVVAATVRPCRLDLRVLAPGDTATDRHPLPPTLAIGTYRLVTHVDGLGEPVGQRAVVSNSFQLVAPPPPN
jgi:hypothetical protein